MCIMNKKLFIRILSAFAVLLISLFIFYMSSKTATDSNDISGSFLNGILDFFIKGFDDLPFNERLTIIENYQLLVRKLAHFTIFAALGAFSLVFLSTFDKIKKPLSELFGWLYVVAFAVSDEIHQLFVLGRTGKLSDVLLDALGGALGILITSFIIKKILHFLEAKKNAEQ